MTRFFAVAACTLAMSAPVFAADILDACAPDIAQYCSAVEVGNGRVASCLYAHETVISDACFTATAGIGDFLDSMYAGLRVIYEACGSDIGKLCGDVEVGEGRIISCLANHEGDLSRSCAPAVAELKPLLPADN